MTKKFFFLVVVLAAVLLQSALPAIAQGPIPDIYVDENRPKDSGDGTAENPYSTERTGISWARFSKYGARLHVTYKDGTTKTYMVEPVFIGIEGIPLPRSTLYVLLAIFALALILVGWQFRRRAHQLRG